MHDINELDKRGIPGGFVATVEFQDAYRKQADGLGFEPSVVWVPHPIQNRSAEELRQLTLQAVDEILAMVRAG